MSETYKHFIIFQTFNRFLVYDKFSPLQIFFFNLSITIFLSFCLSVFHPLFFCHSSLSSFIHRSLYYIPLIKYIFISTRYIIIYISVGKHIDPCEYIILVWFIPLYSIHHLSIHQFNNSSIQPLSIHQLSISSISSNSPNSPISSISLISSISSISSI